MQKKTIFKPPLIANVSSGNESGTLNSAWQPASCGHAEESQAASRPARGHSRLDSAKCQHYVIYTQIFVSVSNITLCSEGMCSICF